MVYAPHWYDLDGLFRKAFGDFTVNVQGLSRVRIYGFKLQRVSDDYI